MNKHVSNRINTLLEIHKMSEYELSAKLGRSKSYINKIVSGKAYPSMQGLFDICDYFEITPEEFFSSAKTEDIQLIAQIHKDLKELDSETLALLHDIILRMKQNQK
ncbi:MAG: helix-turn-helix transcriptional regulator [Eubacteriales bacterium]|nr:helix-turn-helix transcriptional regulator [Eubacteriales bacterium]